MRFEGLQSEVNVLQKELNELKGSHVDLTKDVRGNSKDIKAIQDKSVETKMQVEEEFGCVKEDIKCHDICLSELKAEDERINDELHTKETKVEVERVIKIIGTVQEKHVAIEGVVKLAQHKLEKMEILAEKAERTQGKREIELMREIDEKVKRELSTEKERKKSLIIL